MTNERIIPEVEALLYKAKGAKLYLDSLKKCALDVDGMTEKLNQYCDNISAMMSGPVDYSKFNTINDDLDSAFKELRRLEKTHDKKIKNVGEVSSFSSLKYSMLYWANEAWSNHIFSKIKGETIDSCNDTNDGILKTSLDYQYTLVPDQVIDYLNCFNKDNEPSWFKVFPSSSKVTLKESIKRWVDHFNDNKTFKIDINAIDFNDSETKRQFINELMSEESVQSLGGYLKMSTATVRCLPGAANTWIEKIYNTDNKVIDSKIRSAIPVPFDMARIKTHDILELILPGFIFKFFFKNYIKKRASRRELLIKHAKLNLKQQVKFIIEDKKNNLNKPVDSFNWLFQNFSSLGLEPGSLSEAKLYREVLENAISGIKDEMENPKAFFGSIFGENNWENYVSKDIESKNLNLIFDFEPVNVVRGLYPANKKGWLSKVLFKNSKMPDFQQEKISWIEDAAKGSDKFEQAKSLYLKLNQKKPPGLLSKPNYNIETVRAALMEIMATEQGFCRSGGCKSGKDREYIVTVYRLGLEECFKESELFPDFNEKQTSLDAGNLLERFDEAVIKHFSASQGERVARFNMAGAFGIKNIPAIIGSKIYSKNKEAFSVSEKRSKLNKGLKSSSPSGLKGWIKALFKAKKEPDFKSVNIKYGINQGHEKEDLPLDSHGPQTNVVNKFDQHCAVGSLPQSVPGTPDIQPGKEGNTSSPKGAEF